MRSTMVTVALAVLQILACGSRTSSDGSTQSQGTSASDDETGSGSGTGTTSSSGGSSSAGSTGTSSSSSQTDTSATSTDIDVCEVIDGQTYVSLDEMECGLGPDGPVYCNWHISFDAGTWEWSHSDVIETGAYSCEGNRIDGGLYGGELDTETSILTWEGAEYAPG